MSEKHLTELLWKTLATKQGVKDIGLGKALAAHAALDATKEPAKALEGLKEITELAAKLKKTYLTKADVVAHLEEMVKEVKKATPALEAMAKSAAAAVPAAAPLAAAKPAAAAPAPAKAAAQDEDEEKETAAFNKDLKQQMVSALTQVKARAPGDPEQQKEPKPQLAFMACLAGKSCAVVVARKVGSATKKLLTEIAGVASGAKFVQGECIFEKEKHTFVLEAVPSGLAKKLATALHTETGQNYKVRVRSIDGSVILDSDTDVDPDTAKVGGDPATEWKAKLAEWLPGIKEVLAAKGPNAAAITKLLTQASALSKPGGDMVQALAKLTECHALAGLKGKTDGPTVPADLAKPDPGQQTPAARWEGKRAKITAKLQQEIKEVQDTEDPDAVQAVGELTEVLKRLSGEMQSKSQADALVNYLNADEVVANLCDLAFDLKTPLLKVLNEIRPQLAA